MQITSAANPVTTAGISVLNSANEQPSLAGELIGKTVAALMQMQIPTAQHPVQPVSASGSGGTGMRIDITA